jgi:hypothetical protein
VTIVIDLRSVQAISGVPYNTAAGQAGVEWPRSVFVLVSDDGQLFFRWRISPAQGGPPERRLPRLATPRFDIKLPRSTRMAAGSPW